jgi:copper resistance protein B
MVVAKLALAALLALPLAARAESTADMGHDLAQEHGGGIHHMFRLEGDTGASAKEGISTWDLDGLAGTDENKLWLKSEGDQTNHKLEDAELWAMYSRNIATFWDVQAGIRHDEPNSATYAVLGFTGLAPYYFETEAHLFVSGKGNVSARLREEYDLLLTQKLVTQPYAEVNAYAQDVHDQNVGAGLSDGKFGLQTRYEFTRKFAPYVDVSYGRKFGETSAIAKSNGEDTHEFIGAVGLRLMF